MVAASIEAPSERRAGNKDRSLCKDPNLRERRQASAESRSASHHQRLLRGLTPRQIRRQQRLPLLRSATSNHGLLPGGQRRQRRIRRRGASSRSPADLVERASIAIRFFVVVIAKRELHSADDARRIVTPSQKKRVADPAHDRPIDKLAVARVDHV